MPHAQFAYNTSCSENRKYNELVKNSQEHLQVMHFSLYRLLEEMHVLGDIDADDSKEQLEVT